MELKQVNRPAAAPRASSRKAASARDELLRAGAEPASTNPSRRRAGGAMPRARSCAWSASRRNSTDPKEHLELGRFDMERGARLSGSRFGYIVGDAALGSRSRSTATPSTAPSRTAFVPSSRRSSSARRRCTAPASSRPSASRSTRSRTRACTSPAPRRSRSPDCTWARSSTRTSCRCATPRSPPNFRREAGSGRTGHARHVPRPPVQQGGDVRLRPSRRTRGTSSSGCSRSKSRLRATSASPTASSTSRPRS